MSFIVTFYPSRIISDTTFYHMKSNRMTSRACISVSHCTCVSVCHIARVYQCVTLHVLVSKLQQGVKCRGQKVHGVKLYEGVNIGGFTGG